MFDFAAARAMMVESQLRPNGITDHRILDAMQQVERETFVPEHQKTLACRDGEVPLTRGRSLVSPMNFARLLQIAKLEADQSVLVAGAETGFGPAVVSRLASRVTALESDPDLLSQLRYNMHPIANVTVIAGEMQAGAPSHAPFDVIVIAGRIAVLPTAIIQQAKQKGRIVAGFGTNLAAKLCVWEREGDSVFKREMFESSISALPGFSVGTPAFIFA
jgi:protein-L-isoaspartate(D-aspartate) O-methyltransferase